MGVSDGEDPCSYVSAIGIISVWRHSITFCVKLAWAPTLLGTKQADVARQLTHHTLQHTWCLCIRHAKREQIQKFIGVGSFYFGISLFWHRFYSTIYKKRENLI